MPGLPLDLSIHFEPIVQLHDGKVTARELLVRPVGGGGLLERVEHAEIDPSWITRLALTTAALVLEHSSTPVQVNITPGDLAAPSFVDDLLQQVPSSALRSLILEVTENAPIVGGEPLDRTLETLRALGVRFAIDDFGDGCADVGSIEAVRPEVIKVRLALLHHQGEETDLARSLRSLAGDLDALIVVEQIETPTDLRVAEQLGFPLAQGWFWDEAGRPLHPSAASSQAPQAPQARP